MNKIEISRYSEVQYMPEAVINEDSAARVTETAIPQLRGKIFKGRKYLIMNIDKGRHRYECYYEIKTKTVKVISPEKAQDDVQGDRIEVAKKVKKLARKYLSQHP